MQIDEAVSLPMLWTAITSGATPTLAMNIRGGALICTGPGSAVTRLKGMSVARRWRRDESGEEDVWSVEVRLVPTDLLRNAGAPAGDLLTSIGELNRRGHITGDRANSLRESVAVEEAPELPLTSMWWAVGKPMREPVDGIDT